MENDKAAKERNTIRRDIGETLKQLREGRKRGFWPRLKIRIGRTPSNIGISAAGGGGGKSGARSGAKSRTKSTKRTFKRNTKR